MQLTVDEMKTIQDLQKPESFKQMLVRFKTAVTGEHEYGYVKVEGNTFSERARNRFEVMSLWAFFFGIIPYLIRGMWKKALLLVLVYFVIIGIFVSLMTIAPGSADSIAGVSQLFCILYQAYIAFWYKEDCYRKYVDKEDFWW